MYIKLSRVLNDLGTCYKNSDGTFFHRVGVIHALGTNKKPFLVWMWAPGLFTKEGRIFNLEQRELSGRCYMDSEYEA